MRWTIVPALALSCAAAMGFEAVPVHADPVIPGPDHYINELRAAGFHVDGDKRMTVLTLGLGACVDLFNGSTREYELDKLVQLGGYQDEATTLLLTAQRDLCPKTLALTTQTGTT